MKIPMHIKSTIRAVNSDHPDVIEQQVEAEFLQMEGETQIFYREGKGAEASEVRIFAQDDNMIVLRRGPIRYQQTYQVRETTRCKMEVPGGQMEVLVKTHSYTKWINRIACTFTLEQADHDKLGDYQLELAW